MQICQQYKYIYQKSETLTSQDIVIQLHYIFIRIFACLTKYPNLVNQIMVSTSPYAFKNSRKKQEKIQNQQPVAQECKSQEKIEQNPDMQIQETNIENKQLTLNIETKQEQNKQESIGKEQYLQEQCKKQQIQKEQTKKESQKAKGQQEREKSNINKQRQRLQRQKKQKQQNDKRQNTKQAKQQNQNVKQGEVTKFKEQAQKLPEELKIEEKISRQTQKLEQEYKQNMRCVNQQLQNKSTSCKKFQNLHLQTVELFYFKPKQYQNKQSIKVFLFNLLQKLRDIQKYLSKQKRKQEKLEDQVKQLKNKLETDIKIQQIIAKQLAQPKRRRQQQAQQLCPICLESQFINLIWQCKHSYHLKCLINFLKDGVNKNCPMYRDKVLQQRKAIGICEQCNQERVSFNIRNYFRKKTKNLYQDKCTTVIFQKQKIISTATFPDQGCWACIETNKIIPQY